jgi:hypothetical protein
VAGQAVHVEFVAPLPKVKGSLLVCSEQGQTVFHVGITENGIERSGFVMDGEEARFGGYLVLGVRFFHGSCSCRARRHGG